MLVSVLATVLSATAEPSCEADAALPLSTFAHAINEEFLRKVETGRAREFRPWESSQGGLALLDAGGALRVARTDESFFTYVSDNGWNNQLLNLLAAIDMARLTNRTLIVPPFQWPRRRGHARVSVARLVDLRALARLNVRVLAEDEHGAVEARLKEAGVQTHVVDGEGQPHRKRGLPRWSRQAWAAERREPAGVLKVTCCLFWTWSLPEDVALELHAAFAYHPMLVAAARAAAAPLGGAFAAMHVRRGDKARVDKAYSALFGAKMGAEYFARLSDDEGLPRAGVVFVATDELDRSWFEPLRASGRDLRFVDDLEQIGRAHV